jgi:hypothetical protein
MMTSVDVGTFASGHKLVHRGKTYEFKHLNDAFYAEYERARFARERERLRDDRDDMIADVGQAYYDQQMKEVYDHYRHHEYALDADGAYLQTLEGALFVLSLMLRLPEAEVLMLLRENEQTLPLLKLVIEESKPRIPGAGEEGEKKGGPEPNDNGKSST